MSARSDRNYIFRCINVVFGVFLRESAPTGAKNRTNHSSHRRSCRKPLDRSGPNLTHVCRLIWEWTSAKQINLPGPKGYLEGVTGSHIQQCGKDAKHLHRSWPNLAHICIFIWEWTWAKKITPWYPRGMAGLGGYQFINQGKLPNHWNGRDQIGHTYTDSPGNWHRINKLTPRAPRGIWRGPGGN